MCVYCNCIDSSSVKISTLMQAIIIIFRLTALNIFNADFPDVHSTLPQRQALVK